MSLRLKLKNIMQAKRKIVLFLSAATILKIIIIILFYQNIIVYEDSRPKIIKGYGWDQLVSSMHQGKYEMQMQSGLSDIIDLNSKAGRPPIYAVFLFMFTHLGSLASATAVIFQSIITSLIAYLGYKIVILTTGQEKSGIVCLGILFLFPINFLKSGTVDEAPLMLVFVLASLYTFFKYMQNQNKYILLILSAALLALSTLTRLVTLPVAFFMMVFMLMNRLDRYKIFPKLIIFFAAYSFILFPWIYRNYVIYGKPVLTAGSGRVLLFTQSKEFIESFPYRSPDAIEREYLRLFHQSHKELSDLDLISLDKEFSRYALAEMMNSFPKFISSLITKFKVFFPYRYFPNQNNIFKDIVFLLSYYFSLLFLIWSATKYKEYIMENYVLLIVIIGLIIPGIVYFILSRHLYPIMVIMIIHSFITCANIVKKKEIII